MRICSNCGFEGTLEDFHKDKRCSDGRSYICKKCHRNRVIRSRQKHYEKVKKDKKAHYQKNREYYLAKAKEYRSRPGVRERRRLQSKEAKWRYREAWLEVLKERFGSLTCSRCGYNKHFCAIDGHHVNNDRKNNREKTLHVLMQKKPTQIRIKELDNMILLCRNCHAELHYAKGKVK